VQPRHPPDEPPRAEVIRWLRINLGLTTAIIAAVSAIGGSLVTGTYRVANWDNRVSKIEADAAQIDERLQRIDAALNISNDRRVELAVDLGQINSRLGVLEQQTRFLGTYVQDTMVAKGRR
jgi:hypothetical protein